MLAVAGTEQTTRAILSHLVDKYDNTYLRVACVDSKALRACWQSHRKDLNYGSDARIERSPPRDAMEQ